MKIYLIRHTDADDDRRDSFGGITDDPLIEEGREYAKSIGKLLIDENIELIYTSPYKRATETAKIINEVLNVNIIELYNLRERNSYGVVSGIEKDRAMILFPSIYRRIQEMKSKGEKPSTSRETLPGGEIYLDLLLRAEDAFTHIMRESKLKNCQKIVIISHGGFFWAFFNDVIKIPMDLKKGEIIILKGDELSSLRIIQE